MTTDMRTILSQVASGEITPEEAQRLLSEQAGEQAPEHMAVAPLPVATLGIRASGVRLTVIADPSVQTAVAEGPHRVERVGDRLIVHSDLSQDGYTTETPRSAFMNWVNAGLRAGSSLRVRVNPDLPLEVLNVAGALELTGVRAPISVGVEAGAAKLSNGSGPVKLSVTTGSADISWQFTGTSTVSAELGSAKVMVLPGSDVVVTASATAGNAQIRTAGSVQSARSAGDGSTTPVTVGDGTGTLAVTAKFGAAEVTIA